MQKTTWRPYHDIYCHRHNTVTGSLKAAEAVYSPQLENKRDIFVFLPPSYEAGDQTYPVLYMHDGQNLFDEVIAFAGEWRVDETMTELARTKSLEAIVVGVSNMGQHRLDEYSPFQDATYGGGQGELYLDFLASTLKPLIDQDFRTRPEPAYTGIMGSSLGGLISLYAFFQRPEVFGFAGVMSPSIWFADYAMVKFVREAAFSNGRLYLDAGTQEYGNATQQSDEMRSKSRQYYAGVRDLKQMLVDKGYHPGQNLLHIEEKGAHHHEAAWERRLPLAIEFFLKKLPSPIS
ncbi:MAG: alpha/beta hydrolase-fold protein [Chloroflexota bacterium]